MSTSYEPPPESLALRSRLSSQTASFLRMRPRVTFGKLPAHTVPTLALFRAMLRYAPTHNIRVRIGMLFRKNRGITIPSIAKEELSRGYRWLEMFKRANAGDEYLRRVMERYSRMIDFKRREAYMDRIIAQELKYEKKIAFRPMLTGGILRPTLFHRAMPRMKPQPRHISKMIADRMRKLDRHREVKDAMQRMIDYIKSEAEFERGLQKMHPEANIPTVFNGAATKEWMKPYSQKMKQLQSFYQTYIDRATSSIPPELRERVKQARRVKLANLTRRKERERRGEYFESTLARKRQGPPAHVLATMKPEVKRLDRIVRSVSEVGYVAQAKRKLGYKLKDPKAWKKEGSLDKKRELDAIAEKVYEEGRRRFKVEGGVSLD